jgi:DNA polymerase I
LDGIEPMSCPPYSIGPEALLVSYFASAELGCHLALGWPMPERILDLFAEFRVQANGLAVPAGNNLLGAMAAYGLDSMGAEEKQSMRALVLRGAPWTPEEKVAILDYCQTDVHALARLLPAMLPGILARPPNREIALGQALLRGRYMAAVAQMERTGVPVVVAALARIRKGWGAIKTRLVARVDESYGLFDGVTFKADRFAAFLAIEGIPWPRLPSGALDLSSDAFREMANAHPRIAPIKELRQALSQLRLNELAVGADGRNRTLLSPFAAKTGRNQPSNSRFIFGPSAWLRGLITPPAGHGVAYVDYASQEIGIAAALSADPKLMEAYRSRDVYLAFAKQAGLAPPEATKGSHGAVRDRCKSVVLGINYGMGAEGLAQRTGVTAIEARELLALHKHAYPTFWRWSEAAVDTAMLTSRLATVFGWPVNIGAESNPRSLRNFPMQANGAEMLRLACCLATEAGLEIAAPVHDALLMVAPLDRLEGDTADLQAIMAEASRIVLDGFELRTDAKLVRWPDRYMDERGRVMWDHVMQLLEELESEVVPASR